MPATLSHPEAIRFYNEGCAAMASGRFADAVSAFRQSLSVEPDTIMAEFNLASALQLGGDLAAAADAYRLCAAHHPDDPLSLYNLGGVLDQLGDLTAAVTAYSDCLACQPDHRDAAFNLAGCLHRMGDLDGVVKTYRACLERHPNDRDCLYNLAATLQESGDLDAAITAYRLVMRIAPDHPDAVRNLGNLYISMGKHAEAVAVLEPFCRRLPEHGELMQNLALAKWRARVASESRRDAGRDVRRMLVACMPKSGSTFLADVVANLPGMLRAHLVPYYGRREQELDLELLANYQGLSYVSQLHLRPSETTLTLLDAFRIKPLFLYRNIWDVMASLRDHLMRHSLDWSMAQVDLAFRHWDEERQYMFIARTMMPWFVDFYVGWERAPEKLTVTYEALMADPSGTVARVAAWAGIAATDDEIVRALAATGQSATFNKGGSGRGKSVPEAARARVLALTAHYPDVDFTPLLGSAG